MNIDINLEPSVFEFRSLLKKFYVDSGNMSEKDKIKKAHEYKEDIQKLFKEYDWYSLLSAINSTDDIDRKVVFFLDLIAEQIFENWENKSYSDIIYIRSRIFSINTKWYRALVDKWNEDPFFPEDLTDCSCGSRFLKAVDNKLTIPSGKLVIKKHKDESTLRQQELNFQQVASSEGNA